MITVDKLIFEYPGLRALDNVSFTISQGSITALVGPNGAGKTTLLRSMAALAQPQSGRILIGDIDVLQQPRSCHRVIGYLSDFFGLYQQLSVRQSLHFVGRAQGIAQQDCAAAISRVSQCLQIEDRLEKLPTELSRGQKQRVAIAQAIIHQPRFLLLDEPASGLDPEARQHLADLFVDLQKQGMTLLVSSHILAELEAYSTDMLVLRQGKIVEHAMIKTRSHQQQIYKILLAWPVASLASLLQSLDTVSVIKIENQRLALLQISDQPNAQHDLLKTLLALNLPICEFAPAASHLQDTYLQTLQLRP
jgi:ABC-2 type transport system ATP-binding protein